MAEQTTRHGMRKRLSVLALVIAAALLWTASRVSWLQVRTVDDLRGARESSLTGASWSAELAPLALAALAAVAACLALRGLALRVLSVVLLAVGVAAAVPAVRLVAGGASRQRAAELATPPVLAEQISTSTSLAGPVLALLGALFTIVAAGLLVRSPRTAGGLSSRYRTPAARREAAADSAAQSVDDDVSERLLWDALDAGQDPTAEPGRSERSPAPVHPVGDADHQADSVSGVRPGQDTRGVQSDHERS